MLADVIRTRIGEWRYGYLEAYSEADLRAARQEAAHQVRFNRQHGYGALVPGEVRKMLAYDREMARRGINPVEPEVTSPKPSDTLSPNQIRSKYGIACMPDGTVIQPAERTVGDVWGEMTNEQKLVASYVAGSVEFPSEEHLIDVWEPRRGDRRPPFDPTPPAPVTDSGIGNIYRGV